MAIKTLQRRTFLKGMGTALIGLPLLEIMLDSNGEALAAGTAIPNRFVMVFNGQSTGADKDSREYYTPTTTGSAYALTEALKALGTYNVKGDVSIISGLRIPVVSSAGQGGRQADFHPLAHYPQINGMTAIGHAGNGPGADQIVADAIGQGTTFKTLNYQAQLAWYADNSTFYGRDVLTFRKNARGGVDPVINQTSPRAAFRALFNGFSTTTTNTAATAAQAAMLAKRKSILDLVSGDIQKYLNVLGSADQQRMTRHLDEIRDLERRISSLAPTQSGSCKMLPDPGADPLTVGKYSNEYQRARVFCDLIHMALTCDLSRSATLMITAAQSHMMINTILPGVLVDQHEVGHSGNGTFPDGKGPSFNMARLIAWHVDHYAYLINKIKSTPEGAGTLLDHTALVFLNEGGHGPEGTHCTDNMVMQVAGRAGGLKPGSHIKTSGLHPAHVMITAMNAVGVSGSTLGEISGDLPALFGK